MNPLRYWTRVTIASNPKRISQTLKQTFGVFLANIIVSLIVASFSLMSYIATALFPIAEPIIAFLTLFIMFFMFISLFRRMRKVNEWRHKMAKPAK